MGLRHIFLNFGARQAPGRFLRSGALLAPLHLLLAVSLQAQTGIRTVPQDTLPGEAGISAAELMRHVRYLAGDALEGRAPGTRGDSLAREYVAGQMAGIGLRPGSSDGTFLQRVPIVSLRADTGATLSVTGAGTRLPLRYGSEFVAFTGRQESLLVLERAELVFAGYGIVAPEFAWDDFKGVDLRGKVLLLLNNDPDTGDPAFFGGKARLSHGRWDTKFANAAAHGAAGALIIHTTASAGYGWNVVQSSWGGRRSEPERTPGERVLPLKGWLTFDATEQILRLAGRTCDELFALAGTRGFTPVPLGVTVDSRVRTALGRIETANVLGLLPGSHPVLGAEAVVFTAHIDHLGIGRPVDGDSIYNGAMDNASGVAALLELARAFARRPVPPKRSLLFIAAAAEESGLIGSRHYARNPTFPPGRIAANINIDGINIFGPTRDVVMIGLGRTTVDSAALRAAARQGRILLPDPFPEQGSYYRSDQYSFARIGVPAFSLDGGLDFVGRPPDFGATMVQHFIERRYHQPSDEVTNEWDLRGAVEDLVLTFDVASEIADAPAMPAWLPGDEFGRVREDALRDAAR